MSTHEKPRLQYTKDYSKFEMHELNRDLTKKPVLEESMKRHGFMPSSPVHCVRNGRGVLKIIRGHHRFDLAKKLKLGIWYVVDDSNTDLHDLEGAQSQTWSITDFLRSRAKAGDQACAYALAFQERHGLPQRAALSLVGGESAGSGNACNRVRQGTFRVAEDLSHAKLIGELVDYCRSAGAACAQASGFITALSAVARVPEFDAQIFKHRVKKIPSMLQKQTTRKDYLTLIEDVYNYQAKGSRIPLAFRALEVGKERHDNFGGKRRKGR